MGCASSSPLANVGGAAKQAANDVVHAGEGALHDMGESINETIGNVKDAMTGAVHGLDDMISGKKTEEHENEINPIKNSNNVETFPTMNDDDCKYIPLKGPNIATSMDENLEEFKKELSRKAESFSDDTDKMVDDMMSKTEDSVESAKGAVKNMVKDIDESLTNGIDDLDSMHIDLEQIDLTKSPTHSVDSLINDSPEPEIEKLLSNDDGGMSMSPKHSLSELGTNMIKPDDMVTEQNGNKDEMEAREKEIRTTKEIIKTLSSLIGNNNNLNDNQLINNTKNKAHAREPTPWEILADTIVQQPKTEQKYQNVRTSKSTSLDNLLEVNENE